MSTYLYQLIEFLGVTVETRVAGRALWLPWFETRSDNRMIPLGDLLFNIYRLRNALFYFPFRMLCFVYLIYFFFFQNIFATIYNHVSSFRVALFFFTRQIFYFVVIVTMNLIIYTMFTGYKLYNFFVYFYFILNLSVVTLVVKYIENMFLYPLVMVSKYYLLPKDIFVFQDLFMQFKYFNYQFFFSFDQIFEHVFVGDFFFYSLFMFFVT